MDWCSRLDNCIRWRQKRWLFLVLAVLEMFWFSGFHYGYNALITDYKQLGVFASQCDGDDCTKQEMMFHYAFNSWTVVQMCLISGAGYLMDKVGLRFLKLIAIGIYFLGTIMFAFTSGGVSGLLFPAGILVALGSTSSLICDHQISSMFPKFQGFAIALISGAFDSSTVVTFLITKTSATIPLRTSFVILAFCALVYGTMMGLFVLARWAPDMAKQTNDETTKQEIECVKGDTNFKVSDALAGEHLDIDKRVQRSIESRFPNLKSCILSWPFAAVTLWFMFGLLRFTYFFSQIGAILSNSFPENPETVASLQKVSSILLMAGFVVSPLTGSILVISKSYYRRKIKKRLTETNGAVSNDELYWMHIRSMAPAFLLMAVTGVLYSVLNFAKSTAAFYATCILFTIYRSLLFSACVNFMLIAFPLKNFGTVNGLSNTIGGIFSLLENAMKHLNFLPGTGVSIAISCVLFITPICLFFKRQ